MARAVGKLVGEQNEAGIVAVGRIEAAILVLRGHKVILESDLFGDVLEEPNWHLKFLGRARRAVPRGLARRRLEQTVKLSEYVVEAQ